MTEPAGCMFHPKGPRQKNCDSEAPVVIVLKFQQPAAGPPAGIRACREHADVILGRLAGADIDGLTVTVAETP